MLISGSAVRQCLRTSSFFIRNLSSAARNPAIQTSSAPCYRYHIPVATRTFSTSEPNIQNVAEEVEITFIKADGKKIKAKGKVGDSLLDVVVNSSLDFDGFGACEGTLTCSTCHLIFKPDDFQRLPEKPTDEELDMLDLAYELCDTSRLGCQITLTKDMNGLEVRVPSTINDARAVPDS